MQSLKFRIGAVLVLVVIGILAVFAFALPRFFASSEAAINNGQQKSLVGPTPKAQSRNIDIAATDVPEAEYQARLALIKQYLDEGNFDELVKQGDEIQEIWATDGGERFAKLILAVTNAFGYSRISDGHPEVGTLSGKYATVALERSDSYSLESEFSLVMGLGYYANLPSFNEEDASKLRNSSKLWLHLLTRLENERDPSADPYLALQKQLNTPEDPRWSGVSDPVAKAKFETEMTEYNAKLKWLSDQYKLRNVAEVAEPRGTKFLANVYSKPMFTREELSTLLSAYPIPKSLRKSILQARDELVPRLPQ